MNFKQDYYKILNVNKNATFDEIQKSYREKVMTCHPDKYPGDKQKEELFRTYTEAYEVLKDAEQRTLYDLGENQSLESILIQKMSYSKFHNIYMYFQFLKTNYDPLEGEEYEQNKKFIEQELKEFEKPECIAFRAKHAERLLYKSNPNTRLITSTRYEINNLTELYEILKDKNIEKPSPAQAITFIKDIDDPILYIDTQIENIDEKQLIQKMETRISELKSRLLKYYEQTFGKDRAKEVITSLTLLKTTGNRNTENKDSNEVISNSKYQLENIIRSEKVMDYLKKKGKTDSSKEIEKLPKLYGLERLEQEENKIKESINLEKVRHDICLKYSELTSKTDEFVIKWLKDRKKDDFFYYTLLKAKTNYQIAQLEYDYVVNDKKTTEKTSQIIPVQKIIKTNKDSLSILERKLKTQRMLKKGVFWEIPKSWKDYAKKNLEKGIDLVKSAKTAAPFVAGGLTGLTVLGATDSVYLAYAAAATGIIVTYYGGKLISDLGLEAIHYMTTGRKRDKKKKLEDSLDEKIKDVDSLFDKINAKGIFGSMENKVRNILDNRFTFPIIFNYVPHFLANRAIPIAITTGFYYGKVHDAVTNWLISPVIKFTGNGLGGLVGKGIEAMIPIHSLSQYTSQLGDGLTNIMASTGTVGQITIDYLLALTAYNIVTGIVGLGTLKSELKQNWKRKVSEKISKRTARKMDVDLKKEIFDEFEKRERQKSGDKHD